MRTGELGWARDRIAYVEFYGYQGIDVDAVRKALPFREGDRISAEIDEQSRAAVKRVLGREATDVASVCCAGDGDYAVFIGLPGKSSRTFAYDRAPRGGAAVSAELAKLCGEKRSASAAAVLKGRGEEDGSPGYMLLKEPGARTAILALREYALRHEDEIAGVLESSGSAGQRAMAAEALGYGARTPRQLATLARAARDPDADVRNNATRALGEILRADAAAPVPADTFLEMMRSGTWTDRNKGSLVLWGLTKGRDARLLERTRSEAGVALEEMARWHGGWSFAARMILGRIAGLPEEGLGRVAMGDAEAFFAAIGR